MSDRREMRQWKPFEELEWWGFISDKSRGNQSVSHTPGKPLYGLAIVTTYASAYLFTGWSGSGHTRRRQHQGVVKEDGSVLERGDR